jgi:hypothetical protein
MKKKRDQKTRASGDLLDEPVRLVFETFRNIGAWEQGNLTQNEPSCFNGFVRVKKYRVTIEEVEEPKEVIEERLRKLCRESRNHHDTTLLQATAQRMGITLSYDERK